MRSSPEVIIGELLKGFDERTRAVLERRFGLSGQEPETLEAIGSSWDITRERVRQIAVSGLAEARGEAKRKGDGVGLTRLLASVKDALKGFGHVKREDLLLEALQAGTSRPHVLFLMCIGEGLVPYRETGEYHAYWSSRNDMGTELLQLLRLLHGELADKGRSLGERELLLRTKDLRGLPQGLSPRGFVSALEVSKELMKGYDGTWGLRSWPETNPKGVREKAYLALKQAGEPLHFRDIASRVERLQELLFPEAAKPVLSQTVHNELIKDERFVLVGRGIYGLIEWGYLKGTVREVLSVLLRQARKPLPREKLLELLAAQRQVKESTALLTLQDRSVFCKDSLGRYYLLT
ncbi:hypothetical protein KKI17_01440 [Patescibacteria group bacterium]|nr:hypothetical protein [Patescibacteria group bacterium]